MKKEDVPSLYVGESSRSVQERAMEHWAAARRGDNSSHMQKHQSLLHEGEPPQFLFRVVSYHRTALNRQIKEAVRIRRRGGASGILNSKAEFNRCYIPRLVMEEEGEEARMAKEKREEEEIKELQMFLDEEDVTWEVRKQKERELGKKKRRRQSETEEEPGQSGRRAAKKLKFTLLKEDWGTRVEEEDDRGLEDGNEGKPAVPVLLAKRSRGGQVSPSNKLTSSPITD